jgi:hypothetical protein
MKKFTVLVSVYTLVQSFAVVLSSSQIAIAAPSPASDCINTLFYAGPSKAVRTGLSEKFVSNLCRGIKTMTEATSITECVIPLIFTSSSKVVRTGLSEQLATDLCQGVKTKDEATSITKCVIPLLFSGSSKVVRTGISEDMARNTCAIERPSPTSK